MIKVYIARHGETTWNVEGRIQGRSDPELSPKGYSRSLTLVEQLRNSSISAIFTSTLRRSISTAQPLAEYLGLPIQIRPELDEINFGTLEGKVFQEMEEEMRVEWRYFVDGKSKSIAINIRLVPRWPTVRISLVS